MLTDQPTLLREIGQLPDDLVVFYVGTTMVYGENWIALPVVTPESVKEAFGRVDRSFKHMRVLTNLSKAAPAPACLEEETATLMALHDLSFLVLQQCFATLSQGETSFISLFLGALPDGVPHPFTGLFGGLIKCAHLELPSSVIFGLFSSTESVQEGIQQAGQESAAQRYLPVVVYAQGTRKSVFLQEADVKPSADVPMQLDQDSVIVAVGGARGITAELLKAVAQACRSRLYLIGSNPLHSYADEVFTGSDEEFVKGRPLYIREQRALHPEQSIAAINKAFDRVVDARTARRNIHAMAQYSGSAHVHYIACDVTNRAKVTEVVAEILQAEGNVDLLINAAGLNRSAPIPEKNFDVFRSIRDLKIQAYQNLKHAFKDCQPRMWCNFGSLLGLSGQIGEVDYASANDFLASASTYVDGMALKGDIDGQPRTGASPVPTAPVRGRPMVEFTIGWTLWGTVGLGANLLMRGYFERTGTYSAMTTAEGIYHFMREINQPHHVPAIFHIGEAEKKALNNYLPGFFEQQVQAKPELGFYLDRVCARGDDEVTFERVFDLKRDSYLKNHLVNGYATFPGTFVTEIAAEAATQLVPGMHVIAFEEIQFKHFLRVYSEDRPSTKRIHAQVVDRTDDQVIVQVRILTDIVTPDGKILQRDKEHFATKVVLRHEFPPAPYWESWDEIGTTPVPDPYHAATSPVLLTDIFVSTKDTRIHPLGKRASTSPKLPANHPIFSHFLMPTFLLDGLARIGVLDLVEGVYIPLVAPISIRRLDIYEKINDCQLAQQCEQVELYVTPREFRWRQALDVRNRLVAVRSDGRILAQIKDMVGTLIGYIQRDTEQFLLPDQLDAMHHKGTTS